MSNERATIRGALVAAGVTSLVLGVVDLGLGLWGFGSTPPEPASLTPYWSATTGCVLAGYLLVWFALVRPIGRALALRTAPLALALGTALWGSYAGFLLQRGTATSLPAALASILPLGLVCGAAAYAVLLRWERPAEISTRPWLSLLVGAALAAVLASPLATLASTRSDRAVSTGHDVERVILIVVDTLRADALSCYGGEGTSTPHLDRLADRSFLFSGARSPAPWTLPSVCSILTGASPLVHRAIDAGSVLPPSLPTLAERLAQDGYRTGAIGHSTFLLPRSRLDRGFDEYDWFPRIEPAPPLGTALVHSLRPRAGVDAERLTDQASAWIEEHADEDFFLWLHYFDVHLPYAPPPSHRPDDAPPAGMGWAFSNLNEIRFGRASPDAQQRRWIRDLYEAEARYFDEQLAALVETLERLDLFDGTLIVLTSDHGEEFWEHEGFEHGHTLYDEVLAVPLLVKLPGQTDGLRVEGPVSTESVAATILTTCGLPFETGELLGASLVDADGSPSAGTTERLFVGTGTLYYQDRIAILFDDLKYVRFLETGDEELFDLASDPGEKISIATTAPDRLATARQRCDAVLEAAQRQRERYGTLEGSREELDEEHHSKLRELGYVGER